MATVKAECEMMNFNQNCAQIAAPISTAIAGSARRPYARKYGRTVRPNA